MKRRLFTILAALSLSACVLTTVLWFASVAAPVALEWTGPGRHAYAAAGGGGLYLGWYTGLATTADDGLRARRWGDDRVKGHERTFRTYSWVFGFGERRGGSALVGGGGFGYTVLRAPLWALSGTFALLPGAWAAARVRARARGRLRAGENRCPS